MFALLQLSDSFSECWSDLAVSIGSTARRETDPAALRGLPPDTPVVVSAAGAEHDAARAVRTVRAQGSGGVAVVGAEADHQVAQLLLRAGADCYFALPGDIGAVRAWLVERLEAGRQRAAAAELAGEMPALHGFSQLIGQSPAFRAVLDRARKVVPLGNMSVLITGETGTGKEVLAQALHYHGPRAAHPFVEVNCAALPGQLLESELFGHEKGAFTDARTAKPGLFEVADRGTLFLDEIGDLPLELQAKLLKVLDSKRVRRVGGLREMQTDVRVIAATHQDLARKVQRREFREDLYYRLNVFRLHLPPLRERGRDVVLMTEHFLRCLSRDYALPCPPLTPEVRELLLAHPWRGNVRELRNAVERALVLSGGALHPNDFLQELEHPAGGGSGDGIPFPASLEEISRLAAVAAVQRCEGNKSQAARVLGITRKRLYALLQAAGTVPVHPTP
jgi:two-component system response regulator AtoC